MIKEQAPTEAPVSRAMCPSAMPLFVLTGITLNHAAQIPSTPSIKKKSNLLPA
jgi:hypothetical protein